jgi:hypothetical protein
VLNEFYRIAFRRKIYRSIEELQVDLDSWIAGYNQSARIRGAGVSVRRQCGLSLTQYPSRRRK